MSPRRIAFLDIDGTLIDHDQHLADSAITAVTEARTHGHLVFLCTGRSRAEIPPVVETIGFDGIISTGGGFVDLGERQLFASTMPAEAVDYLTAFFRAHRIEHLLQAYDAVHPSPGLRDRMLPVFAARAHDGADPAEMERRLSRLTPRGSTPNTGIAKATFYGSAPSTFATVRDGLDRRFRVITGTIPYLGEAGGEVSLRGIDKGYAILRLLKELGMHPHEAIAIGDSSNDLEMLTVVGTGIAMGNALESVKAVADEITTSVHDDGVHTAFRRHGLIA